MPEAGLKSWVDDGGGGDGISGLQSLGPGQLGARWNIYTREYNSDISKENITCTENLKFLL